MNATELFENGHIGTCSDCGARGIIRFTICRACYDRIERNNKVMRTAFTVLLIIAASSLVFSVYRLVSPLLR